MEHPAAAVSSSSGGASNVSTGATGSTTGKPGGTIKAAWHGGIDFIDPALAYYQESWQIEYATCVKLLNYPDKPAPAGYQLAAGGGVRDADRLV